MIVSLMKNEKEHNISISLGSNNTNLNTVLGDSYLSESHIQYSQRAVFTFPLQNTYTKYFDIHYPKEYETSPLFRQLSDSFY